MSIADLVNWFIHSEKKSDSSTFRRSRLFVRACLLTSLFSNSYVWLSVYFEYELGVNLMIFNVIGFLVLSFLAKTKLSIQLLSHLYVAVGALAIIILTYYSGGIWSAIYPWIISIPVLALLVAGRSAGVVWSVISFLVMIWYANLAVQGVELPELYNTAQRTLWFVTIVPGLLLIIMLVSLVFESTQTKALHELELKNVELRSQKETIENQAIELKKLIDEKDHFIRIMAHDLKNPLANLSIIIGLLKEEEDLDKHQRFIEMMDQIILKSQALVNNTLDMAILEQGGIQLNLEKIDIGEAINLSVREMSEQARRKDIEIQVNTSKGLYIEADRLYLLLIFENLISNAIKFSPKGKKIQIDMEQSTVNRVRIHVKDQGPGVLPDEQDRLFKKFSKLSARPTGEEDSTGLGLSLVKIYVEQIDGKIWYDDELSKGAAFVVELPLIIE